VENGILFQTFITKTDLNKYRPRQFNLGLKQAILRIGLDNKPQFQI
jgi:hypothetical protein